jgi:PST family polysaccharide transporter
MIFSRGLGYSVLNGVVILVRAISAVIVNKLVVVCLGPSGLLFLGNLKNIYTILQQICGAGVYEGIVKYTSGEYRNRVSQVLQAGFSLMIIGLVIAALLFGFFSSYIFELLNLTQDESSLKIWLSLGVALSLICFVFHNLLQSFFHGKMEYKMVVLTSAISVMLTLILSVLLIYFFGKKGVVASVLLPSVLSFLSYLFFTKSTSQFLKIFKKSTFDIVMIKPLISYTLMSVLAAIVFPSVLLFIRFFLTINTGLEMASYWEGYSKLSIFISGLAISSISLYYLPKLSQTSTSLEIRSVVLWGLKFILFIAVPSLVMLYFFGSRLIPLLYSDAFLSAFFLLKWELLGTALKLFSFAISFLMIAKKMTKTFVVSETFSGIFFLLLSLFLIKHIGVEGASMAYAGTYFVYSIWVLVYFNRKFKFFGKN